MSAATGASGAEYGSISTSTNKDDDDKDANENASLLGNNNNNNNNIRRMSSYISGRSVVSSSLIAFALLWMVLMRTENLGMTASSSSSSTSTSMTSELVEHSEYPTSFLLDETYDATPLFYDDQQVDHLHIDDGRTYSQRYYKLSKNFKGPGHPILVIMGGEGVLGLPMLYPFVHDGLASDFGAFVLSPEHRFYGESQPVVDGYPNVEDMMNYLSPDQALEDAVQLIEHVRNELGCNFDRTHADYCPVISVSYIVGFKLRWNCVYWSYIYIYKYSNISQ